MPTLHNRDRDTSDYRDQRPDYQRVDDREISLGTGTILAIFFALALVCAVFFGLGYSMGRKSLQPSTTVAGNNAPSGNFSGSKPSAGSSINQSPTPTTAKADPARQNDQNDQSDQPPAPAPRDPDAEIVTAAKPSTPESSPTPKRTPVVHALDATPMQVVVRQQQGPTNPTAPAAAMPETNPNGTAIVQVAAVSHQEDADVLISALKKRGYAVFIRQEPQDHLLHVQIGPFATKKDADVMRQRLLADGYNAIVK